VAKLAGGGWAPFLHRPFVPFSTNGGFVNRSLAALARRILDTIAPPVTTGKPGTRRHRPGLEILEARCLPSISAGPDQTINEG
jgi:hypothetical protein